MLTVAGWELRGGGPTPSPLHLAGLPAVRRRPRQAPALPACCSALQPHRVPLHLLLEAVPRVCQLPSQAAGPPRGARISQPPGHQLSSAQKTWAAWVTQQQAPWKPPAARQPPGWVSSTPGIQDFPARGRLKHHRGLFRGSFKRKKETALTAKKKKKKAS